LARAFDRRNRQNAFDVVHTSDYGLAGLFIKKHHSCPHLVFCSWAAELFIAVDGNLDKLNSQVYCRLERYCIRKAWAFTSLSVQRLFEAVCPTDMIGVEAHGNVLAASAFLYGIAAEELCKENWMRTTPIVRSSSRSER
jgi:hypothetical protein